VNPVPARAPTNALHVCRKMSIEMLGQNISRKRLTRVAINSRDSSFGIFLDLIVRTMLDAGTDVFPFELSETAPRHCSYIAGDVTAVYSFRNFRASRVNFGTAAHSIARSSSMSSAPSVCERVRFVRLNEQNSTCYNKDKRCY